MCTDQPCTRSAVTHEIGWFTSRYPMQSEELKLCLLRIFDYETEGGLPGLSALRRVRAEILDGTWSPSRAVSPD